MAPEVAVALLEYISSSSLAIPKVSNLCPEGSCQQYIARSEVQMVYSKGVDVYTYATHRQTVTVQSYTDTLRTKHKDLAN